MSCYAAVAGGLPDAAATAGRGCATAGTPTRRSPWSPAAARPTCLTWEGDLAGAVDVAERAQTHLDAVAGEGMYGGLWLSALALAALADQAAACRAAPRRGRRGRRRAAAGRSCCERVERIVAGGHGRPGDLGPEGRAWHVRALAEHARLAGEPAVEEWQRALDAFGYGHVYEQARCHWRLAEALVAAGDRDAARTHAQAAAAAAERMRRRPAPAGRRGDREPGRGSAAPRSAVDAVLTEREREVLALVAEGLTNREIGSRLFISAKTASVHLSNLMAKLNVSSRTEAVTVAQRRGLLDVL